MHDTYKEKKLSLARALEHYLKLKDEFDLIEQKDLENIKELYKNFLLKNKISVNGMDKIDELGKDEKYIKEGEFDTISEEKDVSDSN